MIGSGYGDHIISWYRIEYHGPLYVLPVRRGVSVSALSVEHAAHLPKVRPEAGATNIVCLVTCYTTFGLPAPPPISCKLQAIGNFTRGSH